MPHGGPVTENEIKIVLGEAGDIWPTSIRPTNDIKNGSEI